MNAAEQAEEFAIAIWHKLQSWKVIHFSHLPQWLQDNDFLHFGHRPPLPTIECFKSIKPSLFAGGRRFNGGATQTYSLRY